MWGFFVLLLHRLRGPLGDPLELRVCPFMLMAGIMAAFQLADPYWLTIACYAWFALMLFIDHRRVLLRLAH